MAAFAIAKTRSLLAMVLPRNIYSSKSEMDNLAKSKTLVEKHAEQKKRFLEVSKNGGMWFS